MASWQYRYLIVFRLQVSDSNPKQEGDGRWYVDLGDGTRELFGGKLYASGRTPTRLPLNAKTDWSRFHWLREMLAWDDEAEHADFAMAILDQLGAAGWELVGIQGASLYFYHYILKRPKVGGPSLRGASDD